MVAPLAGGVIGHLFAARGVADELEAVGFGLRASLDRRRAAGPDLDGLGVGDFGFDARQAGERDALRRWEENEPIRTAGEHDEEE
jgi:hypothetical protein